MAIAKAALGTFLLRLVSVTWHRIVLWVAMIAVSIASVGTCFNNYTHVRKILMSLLILTTLIL